MAKLKMLKYGKKPKANASAKSLQNYLDRCKEVDKKNAVRAAENKKVEALKKRVSGLKQKV